ncbi:MAG: DUF3105 domain-containing protein [Acidimicrobiaceae bacterium]|nr:DUF3105 domain-containing protein [Acidimicrobiaceae bacterium]
MRVWLIVAFALVMSACGDSGSSTEPEPEPAAPTPVETVVAAVEVCPDAVNPAPGRLPVGEVLELSDQGREHVICADYARTPPASGAHFPAWQNCGIYAIPIQNQTAVHSLEHGAVWVAYQPGLDATVLQTMTERLKSERFALVAPYPGLSNPIVLTAWTRQLAVDDWSDPAVEDFLDAYLGRYSPVAPEAGASCGQAVGSAPNSPNLHYQEILEQVR